MRVVGQRVKLAEADPAVVQAAIDSANKRGVDVFNAGSPDAMIADGGVHTSVVGASR